MILLQASNLEKTYGINSIFHNISFIIETGDKIALIGPNGAGKSTLLKCLIGEEDGDQGSVTLGRGITYGYLPQNVALEDLDLSAFELVMEAFQDLIKLRRSLREKEKTMGETRVYENPQELEKIMEEYSELTTQYEIRGGYTFEARVKEVLTGLGFSQEEWERSVKTFSGGQKTRLALARLLARKPELLLLDEPTNYLDLQSIQWLEEFFKQYSGAVLIVSHDRYFLDDLATKVFALEAGELKIYRGNYSQYAVVKAQEDQAAEKAYELQQVRVERLKAYIARYREGIKARQARGRETQLARISPLEKPGQRAKVRIDFSPGGSSGNQVLRVEDLSFDYPGKPIFAGLDLTIRQGERVALVGDNGTGKTTLLKLITGHLPLVSGQIQFGSRVNWVYFAQEGETLEPQNRVLDEFLGDSRITIGEARSRLARFLFYDEDLEKRVGDLSGGERSRLALAKLLETRANFLILDEPTNHLDMETRQVLEDALQDFAGTILMVSHDRYFINQVANQVWELDQQQITCFLGDYDYYRWKKAEIKSEKIKATPPPQRKTREKPPYKNKSKKQNPEELAEQIDQKEIRLGELAISLGEGELYKDPEQAKALQLEYEQLEGELGKLYQEWEIALED